MSTGIETEDVGRADPKSALAMIRTHLRPFRIRLVVATGLSLIATLLELVPYVVVWTLLGQVVTGAASTRFFALGAGVALVAVLVGHLSNGLALTQSHIVAFKMLRDLRMTVANHLARIPLAKVRSIPSGKAKQLLISEPERLELFVAHALPEGFSAMVAWLLVSALLVWVDPVLALVCILPTIVSFVLIFRAMGTTADLAAPHQERSAAMNAAFAEELAMMPILGTLPPEADTAGPAAPAIRDFTEIVTELARRYVPLGSVFFALVTANLCFILPIGLWRLQQGGVELVDLGLFLILGTHYSLPLLRLFNLMHHFNHVAMGTTQLAQILAISEQPNATQDVEIANHEVVIEDAYLNYGDTKALSGVNLVAKPGELTAVVGPSGAGKTSLVGLIPRLEDPDAGRVTLGGHDLREIPLSQLMRHVSFVFQRTTLFAGTIAENLRMACPEASDANLLAALKTARALSFVEILPAGLDTPIGAGGWQLSGGEQQRLSIARALLKDAPVLVLDEATASLDPTCEAEVQAGLKALMQGRTVIAIAHRLHTITHADQIVVLDDGKVVQRGHHAELLAQSGLYANLWRNDASTVQEQSA